MHEKLHIALNIDFLNLGLNQLGATFIWNFKTEVGTFVNPVFGML